MSEVTKKDFQEFTSTILDALNALNDKIDRTESRIMTQIENGIGKQVQANGEKLDALTERVDRLETRMDSMEEHMGTMEERMVSVDQRLSVVESDVKDIKAKLDQHDAEIYTLKRIK